MPILPKVFDDATIALRDILSPRKGGGGHASGGHGSAGSSGGRSSSGRAHSSGSSSPNSSPKGTKGTPKGSSSSSPSSEAIAKSGVSPSTGRPVTRPISFGSSSGLASGVEASPYGEGSSVRYTLGSASPFAGRIAGGALRTSILGTRRYGSGYPYGGYGYYTAGRPFPYVFWPVYWGPRYYGDDEYNDHPEDRPGGPLVSATIQPNSTTTSNSTASEQMTYRLIGDTASLIAVIDALSTNCSVYNTSATLQPYVPSNDSSPRPEEVVQYYRSSSVALTLDIYNNSAASYGAMPASNDSSSSSSSSGSDSGEDTPLPANMDTTFLACLNATIAASLPLLDAPPSTPPLSTAAIVGIVAACLVALAFLVCGWRWCIALRGRRERGRAGVWLGRWRSDGGRYVGVAAADGDEKTQMPKPTRMEELKGYDY